MAERRMFSMKILGSDAFLDLPLSAQALYLHLCMRADDDGFLNNAKAIKRLIGASDKDIDILTEKRFILKFDSGAIVIKHWRIHNALRKDRYHKTQYQDELATLSVKENGAYTEHGNQLATKWQPNGNQLATEDRIGKDSIGNVSSYEDTMRAPAKKIFNLYNEICGKVLPRAKELTEERRRKIKKAVTIFGEEKVTEAFRKAADSKFLTGENDTGWTASLDWILRESSMTKILEDNYKDKKSKRKEDCINDTSEYGDDFGLFDKPKTSLDNATG